MPTTITIDGNQYSLIPITPLDTQNTPVTPAPSLPYNDENTIAEYLDLGKVKMKNESIKQLKKSFHGLTKIEPGKSADVVSCVMNEVKVMNSNIKSGTIYYIDENNQVEHNNYCGGRRGNKRIKSSKKKQRKSRKTSRRHK